MNEGDYPMTERAFFVAGDKAAIIANDVTDARYRASTHFVPVGVQLPTRSCQSAETLFLLEDGTLEFMVGGASTCITAPSVVRVPPGIPYACRNIGDHTARLLVRTSRLEPTYRMVRASIEYAA